MHPDVLDLRDFYRTPMGLSARRILAHRIRTRWKNTKGLAVAGLGYPTPYLRAFLSEAARVAAFMPQEQGCSPWPLAGPSIVALVDKSHLPVPDMSFDRVILVHALEHSGSSASFLREVWRILRPEGRVIAVVPNRRGLWARAERTPFGHGSPYSRGQIERRLTSSMFQVESVTPALFAPPVQLRGVAHAAVTWERAGARLWPMFSGVLIAEAVKQVYAPVPQPKGKRARVRQFAPVTGPRG